MSGFRKPYLVCRRASESLELILLPFAKPTITFGSCLAWRTVHVYVEQNYLVDEVYSHWIRGEYSILSVCNVR